MSVHWRIPQRSIGCANHFPVFDRSSRFFKDSTEKLITPKAWSCIEGANLFCHFTDLLLSHFRINRQADHLGGELFGHGALGWR